MLNSCSQPLPHKTGYSLLCHLATHLQAETQLQAEAEGSSNYRYGVGIVADAGGLEYALSLLLVSTAVHT